MPRAHDEVHWSIATGDMRDNETGQWRSMRPEFHPDLCNSCMLCWLLCPEGCVFPTEKPERDLSYCKGCGICAEECPVNAIEMVPEGK